MTPAVRAIVLGTRYSPVRALGSDLVAFWDANRSDLITIVTGVSSWKDVVAGYDAAQATGGLQPVYSATSYNGAPGVTFDGTDDQLTCLDAALLAALPAAAVPGEIWLVSQDGASSGTRYFGSYGGALNTGRAIGGAGAGRTANGSVGDGAAQQQINSIGSAAGRHVTRVQIGAASTILTLDGVVDPAAPLSVVPSTTNTRLRLGAGPASSAGTFAQGVLSAVLFTKALSLAKAAALQTYLMLRRRP